MGLVYILAHERIPGLVKIGFTETTVEERVRDISSATGVPGHFRVAAQFEVDQPQKVEAWIHKALAHVRLLNQKEFFETSLRHAKEVVEAAIGGVAIENRVVEPAPLALLVQSPEHLGDAIRKARKSQKMTQAELAEKAGCGVRAVVEIEKGKPTAEVGLVLRLLAAAGVRLIVDGMDPGGRHAQVGAHRADP